MTERAAVILSEDLSGVGGVSMSVALPLLTAMDLMPCALPTALLSSHTGGLGANTHLDLSGELPAILTHWQTLALDWRAVVLGYLGRPAQAVWQTWLPRLATVPVRVVDPVMGDHGKLYRGFEPADVAAMRRLLPHATLITPNVTEAQALLDQPLRTAPLTPAAATALAAAVHARFGVATVLTGVTMTDGTIGVFGHAATGAWAHTTARVPGDYFGTGDAFTAVLAGAVTRGWAVQAAARLASTFIARALRDPRNASADPRFGVAYAPVLPWLYAQLTAATEAAPAPGTAATDPTPIGGPAPDSSTPLTKEDPHD